MMKKRKMKQDMKKIYFVNLLFFVLFVEVVLIVNAEIEDQTLVSMINYATRLPTCNQLNFPYWLVQELGNLFQYCKSSSIQYILLNEKEQEICRINSPIHSDFIMLVSITVDEKLKKIISIRIYSPKQDVLISDPCLVSSNRFKNVSGKITAVLPKINLTGFNKKKNVTVPLSNLRVVLSTENKNYTGITDKDGNFVIWIFDEEFNSLKGSKITLTFFYDRIFLDLIPVRVYYLERAKENDRIIESLISNLNFVTFSLTFNNFCNEKNIFYQCRNNNIVFNITLDESNLKRFKSQVPYEDRFRILYVYHFLDFVLDFFSDHLNTIVQFHKISQRKLLQVDYLNYIVFDSVMLADNSKKLGVFEFPSRKRYLEKEDIKIRVYSTDEDNIKYLLSVLTHESAHFLIFLNYRLFADRAPSYYRVLNVEKKNNIYDIVVEEFIDENYFGISNSKTYDSLNEAFARLMEEVAFYKYHKEVEKNILDFDLYENLNGKNWELNRVPYGTLIERKGINVTPSEIYSIVSFLRDILDNTPREIILLDSFQEEVLNYFKLKPSEKIINWNDEVTINYVDLLKIIYSLDNFTFYELYNKLISAYPNYKEGIEKIAKANLLYFINRTGNYRKEKFEPYYKRNVYVYSYLCDSSTIDVNIFQKNDIITSENLSNEIEYVTGNNKKITCRLHNVYEEKVDSKIGILDYSCYLLGEEDHRRCIYELYTFIYNKSQQGTIGIVSSASHPLGDKRKSTIEYFGNSKLKVNTKQIKNYIVEVSFLEDYGIDNYNYVTSLLDDGTIYIEPIPYMYNAQIKVTPFSEEYVAKNSYVINSREMNDLMSKTENDYFDEFEFEVEKIERKESLADSKVKNVEQEMNQEKFNAVYLLVIMLFIILVLTVLRIKRKNKKRHLKK